MCRVTSKCSTYKNSSIKEKYERFLTSVRGNFTTLSFFNFLFIFCCCFLRLSLLLFNIYKLAADEQGRQGWRWEVRGGGREWGEEEERNVKLNKICDNQETTTSSSSSDCSRHVDALMTPGITSRRCATRHAERQQRCSTYLRQTGRQAGRRIQLSVDNRVRTLPAEKLSMRCLLAN